MKLENIMPHTICFHLYEMFRTGLSAETESRLVVSIAGEGETEGVTADEHRVLWGDEDVLKSVVVPPAKTFCAHLARGEKGAGRRVCPSPGLPAHSLGEAVPPMAQPLGMRA